MKKWIIVLILFSLTLTGCLLLKGINKNMNQVRSVTGKVKKKKTGAESFRNEGTEIWEDDEVATAPAPKYDGVSNKEPYVVERTQKVYVPGEKRVSKESTKEITNSGVGEIVYKVPDTMIVFHEYIITVRISKEQGTTEITENLQGNITRKTIKTSERMEVILVDSSPDSAFRIKNINKSGQIIDSVDYTEWKFGVKPLKPGRKTLNLVVSIINGDNIKQKVYSDEIHVKANIGGEVKSWWSKYWQWVFTTVIIPLVIYFWKRKKKEDS